jgi:methionyl-tRNA formyltransferase
MGLNLAFAGTPEFAVPALDALVAAGHRVGGVWTQPDRPAGRGRRLQPSPVKARALALGLPVHQPESLKTPEARAPLAALAPDAMVVVAYGLILPRAALDLPRHGCFNIHASLLPRWRGAAPIQRAILAGDAETGVCVMRMAQGLDTGPVILRKAVAIGAEETAAELHDRLAALGARAMVDALALVERGEARDEPQDDARATYAKKLEKSEARIDWSGDARAIARAVRAFHPWPVAETPWNGQVLRVWRATALDGAPAATGGAAPGTVIAAGKHGIDVACGAGVLRIAEAQLPGGKVLSAAQLAAARAFAGARFG